MVRRWFLPGALVVLPVYLSAAESAKPKPPDAASCRQSTKLVRDIFQDAIAAAKTPEQKAALARKLMEAGVTETKDVGKYVLLLMARDIALDVGILDIAWSALDEMDQVFEIDLQKMKVDAVAVWEKRPHTSEQREQLVARMAPIIDALLHDERFDVARQAAGQAIGQARMLNDPALIRAAGARAEEVRTGEALRVQAKKALAILKEKPKDPAANLVLGKYDCFVRGDWAAGLPMLAAGSDPLLRGLAQRELADPKSADEQAKLGDAWWDAAEKCTSGGKSRMRARAAHWLNTAMPNLSGLEKARVEKRLAVLTLIERPAKRLGRSTTLDLGDGVTMRFMCVPPGSFLMGSPMDEAGRNFGEVQHPVTLSKPYYMAVTEVTQGQWKAIMGGNPSEHKGDDLPVTHVNWGEALSFCRKVSEKTGKQLRLPTEAEWEYACRAGTMGPYGGTGWLNEMAWFRDNSGGKTHPVGQKMPNAAGLYDMHGNVYEWCADWSTERYANEAVIDPLGPNNGGSRIIRGGSWNGNSHDCRSARRWGHSPGDRKDYIGFRCLLEMP